MNDFIQRAKDAWSAQQEEEAAEEKRNQEARRESQMDFARNKFKALFDVELNDDQIIPRFDEESNSEPLVVFDDLRFVCGYQGIRLLLQCECCQKEVSHYVAFLAEIGERIERWEKNDSLCYDCHADNAAHERNLKLLEEVRSAPADDVTIDERVRASASLLSKCIGDEKLDAISKAMYTVAAMTALSIESQREEGKKLRQAIGNSVTYTK